MYRQFNNRQANNVLFNPVMPQQHYPQYVYQQPQTQVRYQPQVQYIQYPQQVQYIKKPAQYLQYQCPVYQQTPYQQVQQGQLVQRPVRYPYIQHAPQAAYVNQYQAKLPMKYAQKLNQVQNPRNGNTYSLDTFEPETNDKKYTINSKGRIERSDERYVRKAFQDNNLMPKINNIPAQTYNNQYGSVIYY